MLKKGSIILGIIIVFSCSLYSSKIGTKGAEFLKIGMGARAIGQGGAFTALSDDASAIFWNPGGLCQVKQNEAIFSHNRWFEDMYLGSIGFVFPFSKKHSIGLGGIYLTIPKITGYDMYDYQIGNIEANDTAILGSYCYGITKNLSAGINIKYINQTLADASASALAIDIGQIYRPAGGKLSLGYTVENVGTETKFETEKNSLPTNIKVGAAFKFFRDVFTTAVDIGFPNDEDMYMNAGVEYWLMKTLALRGGYSSRADVGDGVSMGLGFKIDALQLDYAMSNYGIFDYTHQISLIIRFGKLEGEMRKDKKKKVKIAEHIPSPEIDRLTKNLIACRTYFSHNSSQVLEKNKQALKQIAEIIKDNPECKILIEGHTSVTSGSFSYSVKLSLDRAKAVYDYLMEQGISGERVEIKKHGYLKPMIINETKNNRAYNSRVDTFVAHKKAINYIEKIDGGTKNEKTKKH
ncbi:PorV/PorQ family protein [Elusimicrobiota bacterium]